MKGGNNRGAFRATSSHRRRRDRYGRGHLRDHPGASLRSPGGSPEDDWDDEEPADPPG
jgi:hypothetical protein